MAIFEYIDTFEFSSATVFAYISDLEARNKWVKGILESRVIPEGPAQLGSSYFEAGKYSGYKSEKTMYVTEYEQDYLLTLATPPEVRESFRETYRIEPLSGNTCRVYFTIEVGGVPKVAEFFMTQSMKKEQPKTSERLKAILIKENE
ncbi:SRPBCC family protein [Bacillus sp. SD088]|uniref:SRPBCC family protein n=1 Tax=Bacillus sp. SD088 TaxID=2782012 RepID=UPI001A97598A|nr:SRPBCC family protein [Bacillus sp. SD088]MBO0995627.1 SRPBCC family protein [Bacillus sp. SD088]